MTRTVVTGRVVSLAIAGSLRKKQIGARSYQAVEEELVSDALPTGW